MMKRQVIPTTKKKQREKDSKQRVLVPFNIGERIHKSPKDYKRIKNWDNYPEEYDY